MESEITCPGCGATLTVDSGADEVTCQFCGTHFKTAQTGGETQLQPTPPPEMAAPDLASFAPDAGAPAASSSQDEPLPHPDPAPSEPYVPREEPPVVESIPATPPPLIPEIVGQPPKKSNTTLWIIVAVVAVLVFCLCCLCAAVAIAVPIFQNSSGSVLSPSFLASLL